MTDPLNYTKVLEDDGNGHVTKSTDATGKATQYVYTGGATHGPADGLLQKVTQPGRNEVRTYDDGPGKSGQPRPR